MLYMVEMDLPDRSEIHAWHAWYVAHIGKLLKVPGFNGSQRFEALSPTPSPFLAIHDVDGPELFSSAAYKGAGGPANTYPWQDKMTNWYRNLFDGQDRMPEVGADQMLVVIEGTAEVSDDISRRATWLNVVGLDKSEERRGFIILDASEDHAAFMGTSGMRVFKTLTGKLT